LWLIDYIIGLIFCCPKDYLGDITIFGECIGNPVVVIGGTTVLCSWFGSCCENLCYGSPCINGNTIDFY